MCCKHNSWNLSTKKRIYISVNPLESLVGDSKIKRTKSLLCELLKYKNLFISRRETIAQWTIVRKMDGIPQKGTKIHLPSKWGTQRHFFNISLQAIKTNTACKILPNTDQCPQMAFYAVFVPNRDKRCPAVDFRHLAHYNGECWGFTLLALPGDSRGADRRGMKNLEFCRLHPDDMAKLYFRWAQRGGGSDSSIPNILWPQAAIAVHW